MPRPPGVFLAAALVLAGSLTVPAVADTGGAEPVPTETVASPLSPEEIEDLDTYAQLNGRELSDVVEQFSGVSDFMRMVGEAQEQLPDDFVYAEWGHGSGFLAVRPDGYEAARELVAKSGADSEVLKSDAPAERVQQQLVNAVAKSLEESSSDTFKVGYDFEANRIVASTKPGFSAKNIAIPAQLIDLASESGTRIEIVSGDAEISQAAARGGMVYSGCTGGFIGKPSSGSTYRGIITAKHCTTRPSTYDGATTIASGSSTILGKDLRFTRFSAGTWNNTFRYDAGAFRSVTVQINPVVGSVACKYGRITGRFCTTIARNGVTVTGAGSGMSETASGSVQPGDSGGPWYYGNSAMGITYGYTHPVNQPTKPLTDLFTPLGSNYYALTS